MAGIRAALKRAKVIHQRRHGPQHRLGPAKPDRDPEPPINDGALKRFAGLRLRYFLLSKFASGLFHATDVAAISHWASLAGVDAVADLACSPDELHFVVNAPRKVGKVSGVAALKSGLYWADVPMSNDSGQRVWTTMPFYPIHEAMISSFERSPDTCKNFADSLDTANWKNHQMRQEMQPLGVTVIPFGMFEDAAPYKGKGTGSKDSMQAGYANLLGFRERHAIYILPKSRYCGEQCGCSCRGRCTQVAIEKVLLYFCQIASSGHHPAQRHDGLAFTEDARRNLQGSAILSKFVRKRFEIRSARVQSRLAPTDVRLWLPRCCF